MTIDTHIHFYDPSRPEGVPWPPTESPLYRPVLPGEWRSLAEPCGVTRAIVVEASERVEDNAWVLGLAHEEPAICGVVGRLDPTEAGFPADLERFAADPLFRGIRLNGRVVTDAMRGPGFRGHLIELASRGLVLELNVGPELLDHVFDAVSESPDLTIVLDHMAGSDRADGQPATGLRDRLRRLSGRPNVYCKLSGFVEAASRRHDPVPNDPAYYRPMFDVLLETMGHERLLYSSNWPVSALMAPYPIVCGVLDAWVADQDETAQSCIRRDNATVAYRLQA
jgi:L-fuconolactonase